MEKRPGKFLVGAFDLLVLCCCHQLLIALQARLEEARSALAEEASAYYPEVGCLAVVISGDIVMVCLTQVLPDLKANLKKIHQQEYASI